MSPLKKTCALIERGVVALAKSHGLDFNERCILEDDDGAHCESSTCVATWYEDHDPFLARDQYRKDARTVLGVVERADVVSS